MISTAIKKIVAPCWKPSSAKGDEYHSPSSSTKNPNGRFDGLVWRKNLGKHVNGEFSMAVIKANNLLEDYSQLDSGPLTTHETDNTTHGTFVGIYDGHGGPEAARFVCDHLFNNIKRLTSGGIMSAEVIMKAYLATEEEFLSLVKSLWKEKPQLASVGSCCLVGVVCNGYLYIANVGDSRVVLGQRDESDGLVKPIQLSCEHNVCYEHVRNELHSMHPHDPNIVVLKRNCWRVKGLIQVSRSIGDAYLKRVEFNKPPLLPKFRIEEHFSKPILTAEPWISVKKLDSQDKFLIFASDGLWDHLTNKRAVDIINTNPRNGVAKKLVKAALCEAAKKREMRYSDLKKIDRGVRRHFHDDITVIVLFLDFQLVSRTNHRGRSLSIRGANYQPPPGSRHRYRYRSAMYLATTMYMDRS